MLPSAALKIVHTTLIALMSLTLAGVASTAASAGPTQTWDPAPNDDTERFQSPETGVPNQAESSQSELADDVTAMELNGGKIGQGYTDRLTGKTYDGMGNIVVVIDGAFNPDHPYFNDRVISEACFGTDDNGNRYSGNLCSEKARPYANYSDVIYETGAGTSKYDRNCVTSAGTYEGHVCNSFHGSMAAGHVAGQPIVSSQIRAAGIAPGAELILIKVGNNRTWNTKTIAPAIDYVATSLTKQYPGRIAAISLSTDGPQFSDNRQCEEYDGVNAASKRAYNAGIAVVFSSGNNFDPNNPGQPTLPHLPQQGQYSCEPYVTGVGATRVADTQALAYYSRASKRTSLLAPVGNGGSDDGLWTAYPYLKGDLIRENNYTTGQGTSFASPQIAGAFAVLRQKYPKTDVDDLRNLLQSTGDRVLDSRDQGTGIVTPRSILSEAINSRGDSPAYDYLRSNSVSFPILAGDKSLRLLGIDQSGKYDSTSRAITPNLANRKFIIPVRDFLHAGSNGFVSNDGDDLAYWDFDPRTIFLSAPRTISKGGAVGIDSGAAATGLSTVGTGKSLVLQRATGEIIMRTVNIDRASVSPPKSLISANENSQLVGVADINSDGKPDLVTSDKTLSVPLARFGTDDHSAPFSTTITQLSTATFWKNMTQMWVMDDFVSGRPVLGYTAKVNRNMIAFTFTPEGRIDHANYWTAVRWAPGVEVLMAPDSTMHLEL